MKATSSKTVKYQSGNLILKQTEEFGPLVLGDCNSAMDKKIQKEFNIQTVISIGQQAMPIKQKLPQNCKHYFYDIHDNKSQKVHAQLFDQVNKLIDEGRKNGGVLIHCYAGVSRSSTFVIAYIMQKFLKSYDIAKYLVKNARSCIYPNDGFVHHLKNYQKVLEKRQQQRLRKIQEQKRAEIQKSLVRSARKSVRGGVKSADISPEKVKQMAEQSKRNTHELIIEPIQVIKQQNQDIHTKNSTQTVNLKEKVLQQKGNSKSLYLTKAKISSQRKKQQVKLPKVNNKIYSERKNSENINLQKDELYRRSQKSGVKSQSISNFEKTSKYLAKKSLKQKSEQSFRKQDDKQSMRQSKSIASTKRQKSFVLQIDQSLLNQHEKKIKKIYQAKIQIK